MRLGDISQEEAELCVDSLMLGDIGSTTTPKHNKSALNMHGKRERHAAFAEIYATATGINYKSNKATDMGHLLAQLQNSRPTELYANGAKYKTVDKKMNPVPVSMPALKREPYKPLPIPVIPPLPTNPPDWQNFTHTKKLTPERLQIILNGIQPDFLSDDEISLLIWVLRQNEDAIAFEDSERGLFKEEFFPDYIIETVPHQPWQEKPIKVPESVKEEMTEMLRQQVASGNLEPAQSSYRSRIFVVKKPKGGLRIVHDLQPLNKVTAQDAMLPPNVADFAQGFVGYSIYGTMDLYSGYHQRRLHPDSRPLTACQTPLGNMQLTSLPMGATNSMQEFQRATMHITYNMGEDRAEAFVDDIGIKGPKTRYNDKPIPENAKIRRFVWEYAHTLYECLATLIIAGATASGKKLVLAAERVNIVGHTCSLEGIRPHHGIASKVINWPTPKNVTGVRGFLGTIGVARNWIKNFARIAKPLTLLTKATQFDFEWSDDAQNAMNLLKKKVQEISALKRLDVKLAMKASLEPETGRPIEGQVILAVDSSYIAIGFVLYQVLWDNDSELLPEKPFTIENTNATDIPETINTKTHPRRRQLKRFPLRFGSITLNDVESRYSQPKVELYGLFRSLKALENLLWGLKVFVEADASFIPKTANAPGLPNAATTHWVSYIRLFTIRYKHIPANQHVAPDGLSRRARATEDSDNTDINLDTDDGGPYIRGLLTYEPPLELPLELPRKDEISVMSAGLCLRSDTLESKSLQYYRMQIPATVPQSIATHVTTLRSRPNSKIEIASESEPASSSTSRISLQKTSTDSDTLTDKMTSTINVLSETDNPSQYSKTEENLHWKNITSYLQTMEVPPNVKNWRSFILKTRRFFIYQNVLWKRSPGAPRRVIIKIRKREELVRQAHEESGHRGRHPTYKKLADFYFWPNMYRDIAIHCRTCHECQLRSTYRPVVPINPTWVPTIFRKFNLDLVDMGITSGGYKYIVDMRDDLSGWIEARMLASKSSADIAKFIYEDVICRFGCIPQITTDNGQEFHGVVKELADRFGIKIVRSSPYHPEGNGMIERGHRTWIESIWKLCGRSKKHWSEWFHAAIWADRVTVRRNTRFSPYHLLYGRPHLFPFTLEEETWYTIPWHKIRTTEELLEARARQLRRLQTDRTTANSNNIAARKAAAQEFAKRHANRLVTGNYRTGEYVLVALKGNGIKKGYGRVKSADRWAGPFRIKARYKSGSYIIEELNGVELRGTVPANHLRPFYTTQRQLDGTDLIIKRSSNIDSNEYEWIADEESDNAADSPYIESD